MRSGPGLGEAPSTARERLERSWTIQAKVFGTEDHPVIADPDQQAGYMRVIRRRARTVSADRSKTYTSAWVRGAQC